MAFSNFRNWHAYRQGFTLAAQIYRISRAFPKEECYSLTDQIRRSSRSVCSNLAEGSAKLRYPKHFISKVTDAAGENAETQTWLAFALDCGYINQKVYDQLILDSESIAKLLNYMEHHSTRFTKLPTP